MHDGQQQEVVDAEPSTAAKLEALQLPQDTESVQVATQNTSPTTAETRKKPDQPPLHKVAGNFLRRTDDMVQAYVLSIEGATLHIKKEIASIRAQIKPHIVEDDGKRFSIKYPEDVRDTADLMEKMRKFDRINEGNIPHILSSSLFIGIFSQFDAFMGSLLKEIYSARPELFKGINKDISLKDLIDMGSIEAAKEYILEKEIDTFRRESYAEQFAILERKFSIKTLRKFPEWKMFIEMSQRRNLITHNDGVVNEQYRQIVKSEGFDEKTFPPIGKRLLVKPEYFMLTCLVLSAVSVMLTHTLWRTVLPDEIEREARCLTETVYYLLLHERYNVAIPIGKYSLTPEVTKGISEADIRIRAINLCIAYKNCNLMDKAKALLDSYDWSATPIDFKLARHVLSDEFPDAISSMHQIGREGMFVNQMAYHDWPLFMDFRKRQDFRDAYREIYECDFEPVRSDEPRAETIENILELAPSDACDSTSRPESVTGAV
ncbi:hypothetical protein [Burkholderia ambifaria]|uniref:hypothetical protein n=1 Tax=Burkholderia ambifaria TaxID=152480 RepID=UPI00158DE932|nr:hypothetical protein [Burkholderia ambifaria]